MLEPIAVYYEYCDFDWKVTERTIENHLLIFITDGMMDYFVNGEKFTLCKGDALYVPMGALRSARHMAKQKHEMYVAHFHYEKESYTLPVLEESLGRQAAIFNQAYYSQRFSLLTQQWLRKHNFYQVACHYNLLELLTLLNIELTHQENPAANNLVMQIQEYIADHYREKIELKKLAKLVDRTPSYISTVFHTVTGQTITEYIQQIRLSAARDLLTKSHMTIGEISNYLGFCEQSYFNKVFKKAIGVPPSAFMKEHKQKSSFQSR
ncbi:helix-turn-helix domain-containing protein [Paenibacillus sp. IITD108]|uniref:helix-turn-helix domain-containing protein n=1 Tax=Paenibacillus sp. IITD108 TaxID=3116649 RepID=UPI002F421972